MTVDRYEFNALEELYELAARILSVISAKAANTPPQHLVEIIKQFNVLVLKIIQLTGNSEPDVHSTISLYVEAQQDQVQKVLESPECQQSYHILIIDPEEICHHSIQEYLQEISDQSISYQVTAVETAEAALESIKKQPPDFIFLEVTLPDRSGLNLLKTLQEKYPDIQICLLNAYTKEDLTDIDVPILQKPFSIPDRLMPLLEKNLPSKLTPAPSETKEALFLEIIKTLNKTQDLEAVLHITLEGIQALFGVCGTVYKLEDDHIIPVSYTSEGGIDLPESIPLNVESVIGQVLLSQEPSDKIRQQNIGTWKAGYTYPIMVKGKVVGGIQVGHENPELVSDDLKAFIRLSSDAIALALVQAEQQEALKKVLSEISANQEQVAQIAGNLSALKSNETANHIKRVGEYARLLCQAYNLNDKETRWIAFGSQLHDVGKMGISGRILHKPGKLTPEEYQEIQNHTVLGYMALKDIKNEIAELGAQIALYHHEKWDGSGYPLGLKKEEIPLAARITAFADVLDAISSKRVYKEAFGQEEIDTILQAGRGTHFDPVLVNFYFEHKDELITIRNKYPDQPQKKPSIEDKLEASAVEVAGFITSSSLTECQPGELEKMFDTIIEFGIQCVIDQFLSQYEKYSKAKLRARFKRILWNKVFKEEGVPVYLNFNPPRSDS